jgi:predicted RNA-binding protein with PUA-like domain
MVEKLSKIPAKSFWLIKSEADCFSIDDLKREGVSPWTGVRNFQARNFMRDSMKIGDVALFYHSNSKSIDSPTGIYGLAKVASSPYGDPSALDTKDEHFDPRSLKLKKQAEKDGNDFVPIWVLVDFEFVKKFKRPVSLKHLKMDPALKDMIVCQKGSRLSIQPVSEKHFNHILSIV